MRRKASKLVLISAGAALAWFLDPVSGSDRRRQVTDRLSALTGGPAAGSDPTGGAFPPAVADVQPTLVGDPGHAPHHDVPPEPELVQAVEAAAGGEKVLRSTAAGANPADLSRTPLSSTS
jgi:hypothetical protein